MLLLLELKLLLRLLLLIQRLLLHCNKLLRLQLLLLLQLKLLLRLLLASYPVVVADDDAYIYLHRRPLLRLIRLMPLLRLHCLLWLLTTAASNC